MKDSRGQTVQYHCPNCGYTAEDAAIHGDHYLCERKTGHPDPRKAEKAEPQAPTIVQDYREYTEREILLGILDFSRRTGWGDPANLGRWLGAAQRWALKERV